MISRLNSLWIGEQLGYIEKLNGCAFRRSLIHNLFLHPRETPRSSTRSGDLRRERSGAVSDACSLF